MTNNPLMLKPEGLAAALEISVRQVQRHLAEGMPYQPTGARGIRANIATFKARADGMESLFADLQHLVRKADDDCGAVLDARIAKHRADEAAKAAARAAAEAQRIAAAEQLARHQEIHRQAAEAAAAEAARQQVALVVAPYQAPAPAPAPVAPTPLAPRAPSTEIPTLRLGQISERLGYVVTADLLAQLGFVARADRASNKGIAPCAD